MESRAFSELKYRAWIEYLNTLIIDKEIEFNWERKLPVGRSKHDHYLKASAMLLDLIKDNVENPEMAVLMIPANILPILAFAESYTSNDVEYFVGAYQPGTLGKTAVVVEPTIPVGDDTFMLLFDLAKNKLIHINPGKYDYEADKAALMTDMEVMR